MALHPQRSQYARPWNCDLNRQAHNILFEAAASRQPASDIPARQAPYALVRQPAGHVHPGRLENEGHSRGSALRAWNRILMKMREEEVVSSSVRRMAASTSQLIASVASRCAKNLATLRSCAPA